MTFIVFALGVILGLLINPIKQEINFIVKNKENALAEEELDVPTRLHEYTSPIIVGKKKKLDSIIDEITHS